MIMRNRIQSLAVGLALMALAVFNFQISDASGQGTGFTYQGRLEDSGGPANGIYNLQFSLYAGGVGGAAIAGPETFEGVSVSNGLFTVTLDFGESVWIGTTNWLQIGVEPNGGGSFQALTPRQLVASAPYAITAGSLLGNGTGLTGVWQTTGNAGTVAGGNFVGTTDNQPLEFHVNGERALRLEPGVVFEPNVIGGAENNSVGSGYGGVTIAGGFGNTASGADAVSGGGYENTVNGAEATVAGGGNNSTSAQGATVAGGFENGGGGPGAFVGGGGYDGGDVLGQQRGR